MIRKGLCLLLLPALILNGCASTTHSEREKPSAKPQLLDSASEEVAIGEQIHSQIISTFFPYTDPKVTEYIAEIGRKLVLHAKRQELPYRFTLLYDDKIYATSAPGGFVYLTTGMIYFLDNEAELAGIMAHEIGQLQYRDPRLSHSREVLEQVMRTASMVAPAFGGIGALAAIGLALVHSQTLPNERSAEQRLRDADRLALKYLLEAGYDPQGFMDVQEKFLRAKDDMLPYFYDYYQSRPLTEERWLALTHAFGKLPLEGKDLSTRYQEFQEATRGVRDIYKHPV